MHLASLYALATGSKIDKPYIKTAFYPTPEKYITVNLSSHMIAKLYDYWDLVIQFILPGLNQNNVKIIQLGGEDEKPLANCINLLGQTSLAQSSYIIQNALAHVGADSALSHVSSVFNTPMVTLFSVSAPTICGAFWGDPEKQINLEPNFKNGWYSFNPQESPKSVNSIRVEDVVNAIGKLLNIDFPKTKTLFTGNRFNQSQIDVVPDTIVDTNFFPGQVLNFRLDYLDNIDSQNIQFLQVNLNQRTGTIVTDKTFPISSLIPVKKNLGGIICDLSNWDDEEFIKSLSENHIKFAMIFDGDEEKLKQLKLKYCEYGVIQRFEKINKELKDILDSAPPNSTIKTNRIILSNGRIYISRGALRENKPIENYAEQKVSCLDDRGALAEDADFLYLYC